LEGFNPTRPSTRNRRRRKLTTSNGDFKKKSARFIRQLRRYVLAQERDNGVRPYCSPINMTNMAAGTMDVEAASKERDERE
jgi:hypothetical protein